jgi:hypothetical protein
MTWRLDERKTVRNNKVAFVWGILTLISLPALLVFVALGVVSL